MYDCCKMIQIGIPVHDMDRSRTVPTNEYSCKALNKAVRDLSIPKQTVGYFLIPVCKFCRYRGHGCPQQNYFRTWISERARTADSLLLESEIVKWSLQDSNGTRPALFNNSTINNLTIQQFN